MRNYKGGLLDSGMEFGFGIVFIGILLGAGAIALAAFSTSQVQAQGSVQQNQAVGMIYNATTGVGNFSAQMPTVGTIAGVGLILIVLFSAIGVYVLGRQ